MAVRQITCRESADFMSLGATADSFSRYNISTPDVLANQSILLVPFHQVELLVDDIRKRFAVSDLTVPGYPFTINFFNDNAPKPSFLGTCNAEADISDLKAKVEAVPWGYGEMSINASEAERSDLETFMMKCRDMLSVDDRKNKTTKKKKEKRRVRTMEGDLSTLQRAQEYLGLRPASMTRSSASLAQTPVVDLTKPSPYPPHREPVLISVDVESYERDHSLITEIGVSTLDTRDLHDLAPGETGDNWTQKIRSRHFRIKDREHYVNYQYCIGDAGKFLFGKSEFISIAEAGVVIDSCFQPPFSAAFTCSHSLQLDNKDNPDTQITNLPERSSALVQALQTPTTTTTTPSEPRTILLIGHDLTADTTYLSSLSSKVFRSYPPSSEDNAASTSTSTLLTGTLDTATLHKQLTHASQPRSLTVICHDLDITPWHAHNAGNDARYTLEVFLKIALKASQQQHKPDSSYRKRDRQRDRKSTQNNTREGGGLDTGTIAVSSMQNPSSMKGASSMTSHANTLGENTRVHTTDRRNDRAQITSDVTIESDDNKRNNIANNDRSARVEQQQQQHHQEQLQEQNDEPARYRDPASDEEPY